MMKEQVLKKFNEHAATYDEQRKKLIPCFDDFYSIPISLIESDKTQPTVLDIGAGTGLISAYLKEKFPEAQLTLIDLSEKMLEVAKQRFQDEEIDYVTADYTTYKFEQTFDIIISSLSIHHLSDEEKRKLYQNVYTWLNPGGIFINADQVLGHTPSIDSMYKQDWWEKISASGLTPKQLDEARERTKLDRMSTLQQQLDWLTESGFRDVDCVYKYFNFVVLVGKK
ncbi:class I SAM-dependent methyltransferase [Bacillus sp. FJAT-42315]|uniref:class I SAM-dependent methyltransferase n=1 Tax=Bacillus sp. FJAT-42315 TaxID=2014077 RepID=UPI001E60916C|nr:class I SAM-dependent methyltransferase [Bacillus sp. FJAT-42315]